MDRLVSEAGVEVLLAMTRKLDISPWPVTACLGWMSASGDSTAVRFLDGTRSMRWESEDLLPLLGIRTPGCFPRLLRPGDSSRVSEARACCPGETPSLGQEVELQVCPQFGADLCV